METPRHVPWWVFLFAVSAAISYSAFVFWRIEGAKTAVEEIRTDVAVVKNDTAWIKSALEKSSITTISSYSSSNMSSAQP